MPTRSLRSAVMRWPDRAEVDAAFLTWASVVRTRHPEVVRIGYIGSYARDQWGVGSDLDVVILVARSEEPFHRRLLDVSDEGLPVPADLLVFTEAEMDKMRQEGSRLAEEVIRFAVWA